MGVGRGIATGDGIAGLRLSYARKKPQAALLFASYPGSHWRGLMPLELVVVTRNIGASAIDAAGSNCRRANYCCAMAS
jgi:hypothetical protein